MTKSFIIEGLDRLGKSTLVQEIQNTLGFYQSIHFGKPQKLDYYETWAKHYGMSGARMYQGHSFANMFALLASNARVIFDRAHLGECVYSPIYRKYDGDYVFELEKRYDAGNFTHTALLLLVEDFKVSKHFVDDGESFDITKREQEQELFIAAFNKSILPRKKIICVTEPSTGSFRSKEDILNEALKV